MAMHEPTAAKIERDPDSTAAVGWLSFAGVALFSVLLAVHVVGRTGAWSHVPATWAQPAAATATASPS